MANGCEKNIVDKTPTSKTWEIIERVAIAVSILAGLSGGINDLISITSSLFWMHFISVSGFLVSVLIILIVWNGNKTRSGYRALPIFLLVWTAVFSGWVGTWIIPSQVITDSQSYPIEKGNVQAINYRGLDFGKQGDSNFSVTSSLQDRHFSTTYHIKYNLPPEESFAGVSLYFAQPIDISNYKYLEFKVRFDGTDGRFRIVLKESETIFDGVTIGDGTIIIAKADEQIVQLELNKYFPGVNYKSIRKIDLHVDNTFISGSHYFDVGDVRFIR
jgi:hypothetical protein